MYMYYVCTSLLLLGPLLPLTSLPTSPCVPWLQLADSSLPASLSGGPGSMGWDGMGWAGLGLLQKDGQDERAPGQTGTRADGQTDRPSHGAWFPWQVHSGLPGPQEQPLVLLAPSGPADGTRAIGESSPPPATGQPLFCLSSQVQVCQSASLPVLEGEANPTSKMVDKTPKPPSGSIQ